MSQVASASLTLWISDFLLDNRDHPELGFNENNPAFNLFLC
jgi:hypothetical protein